MTDQRSAALSVHCSSQEREPDLRPAAHEEGGSAPSDLRPRSLVPAQVQSVPSGIRTDCVLCFHQNCLRRRDAGLISQLQELDQQISDLRLDSEVSHDLPETDSRPSSGTAGPRPLVTKVQVAQNHSHLSLSLRFLRAERRGVRFSL